MKKWYIMLLLVLTFSLCSAANAEHKMVAAGENTYIYATAQVNGALVCLDSSSRLQIYDLSTEKFQEIEMPQDACDILSFHGCVYGAAFGSGTLTHLLNENGQQPAQPQDITIPLDLSWDEYYMSSFQADGNVLYFEVASFYSEDRWLYRYDLSTGDIAGIKNLGVFNYAVYQGTKVFLLQYKEDGRTVSTLDFTTKAIQPLFVPSGDAGGLVYDSSADRLYYTGESKLMAYQPGGEARCVSVIPFSSQQAHAVLLQDRYFVAMGNGGLMYFYDLTAQQNTQQLKVLGGYSGDSGHKAFLLSHPQVSVDVSQDVFEVGSTEDFIQGLITGTLDYDVMRMQTTDFDLSLLTRKGYCAPIDSPLLHEKVLQMYPQMQAAALQGGTLYAVPARVSVPMWESCYIPNWLSAGLSPDEIPASYTEFLDFIVSWSQANSFYVINEMGEYRSFLFSMLLGRYTALYEYSGEALTFDTPLFRDLLQQTKAVAAQLEGLPADGPALFFYGDVFSSDALMALPLGEGLPPLIKGSLTVYVINPRSPRQALAIEYIESCLNNLTGRELLQLYPDEHQPVEQASYASVMEQLEAEEAQLQSQLDAATEPVAHQEIRQQLDALQQQKEAREAYRYQISPQQIEEYHQQIAPALIFPGPSVFDSASGDLLQSIIRRYLDGAINEQTLIDELDSKIRIMQLEAGL